MKWLPSLQFDPNTKNPSFICKSRIYVFIFVSKEMVGYGNLAGLGLIRTWLPFLSQDFELMHTTFIYVTNLKYIVNLIVCVCVCVENFV